MSDAELVRQIARLENEAARLRAAERAGVITGTWSPTWGGFSSNPNAANYRYYLFGKLVVCMIEPVSAGASNATNYTMTGPFTAATVTNGSWRAAVPYVYDNGALTTKTGSAVISSASSTITIYSDPSGAAWTASGNKMARFTIIYEVA